MQYVFAILQQVLPKDGGSARSVAAPYTPPMLATRVRLPACAFCGLCGCVLVLRARVSDAVATPSQFARRPAPPLPTAHVSGLPGFWCPTGPFVMAQLFGMFHHFSLSREGWPIPRTRHSSSRIPT